MKLRRLIGLATAALILVSCGGGGNGNHQEGMSNATNATSPVSTSNTAKQLLTPYGQIVNPAGILLSYGSPLSEQHAMDCSLSPDGSTLAVKGRFNLVLVDTASRQIIRVVPLGKFGMGTYKGIAWSKDGQHVYLTVNTNYKTNIGRLLDVQIDPYENVNITQLYEFPAENGKPVIPNDMTLSKDGQYIYLALNGADKVIKFDIQNKKVVWEKKVAKFPYGIALANGKLYVTDWGGRKPNSNDYTAPAGWNSVDHDEPIVANPENGGAASGVVTVMDTDGNIIKTINVGLHPNAIVASQDGSRVYVANGNSDTVSVIDTSADKVIETVNVMIDTSKLPTGTIGASPNALVLSPDGKYLYVADGTINAVAVVKLSDDPDEEKSKVIGFIPTGAYPGGLSISSDGRLLYVADTEGLLSTVPNQANGSSKPAFNVYDSNPVYNTHKELGYISIIDIPYENSTIDNATIDNWTQKTNDNIHLSNILKNLKTLDKPRKDIQPKPIPDRVGEPSVFKHVIYIIKENRSYDQVLGDMKEGNGDPNLVVFGKDVTPNEHKIAKEFLLLDKFYTPSKCSAEGHPWADAAYVDDYVEKNVRAWFRGYYHNIFDAMVTPKTGYIWDDVLNNKLTFEDFGEALKPEFSNSSITWKDIYNDYRQGKSFSFTNEGTIEHIIKHQDKNYPGYDSHKVPDQVRAEEFIKKLHEWEQKGSMPNFIIMALPDDHTAGTKPGFPTVRAMVADNDLALGKIVDAVSHSKFYKNTVIFVTEDDSQDGWDHVSAYRTTGFVISAYSRLKKPIHTYYNSLSMVHTMEQILGIRPMNLYDLSAPLMKDCFTDKPDLTPYTHVENQIPLNEMNPSPKDLSGKALYWSKVASKIPDELDVPGTDDEMNKMIWYSVKGYNTAYPEKYTVEEDTDE